MTFNIKTLMDGGNPLFICMLCLFVVLLAGFIFVLGWVLSLPSLGAETIVYCHDLSSQVAGLSYSDCKTHLQEYPGSTGQEIVDANVVPLDQLLTKPLS